MATKNRKSVKAAIPKKKLQDALVVKSDRRIKTHQVHVASVEGAKVKVSDSKVYTKGQVRQRIPKDMATVSFDWNDDNRGYQLVSVIRDGVDYRTYQIVAEKTPLNDNDWAVVLGTTTRTLERYKKDNKKFASKQTEKIIEIQQLMQYGEEVFGDVKNFHGWIMSKNIAMGGVIPKDLLDTSVGLGMVKDALTRIEHGIFA